MNKAQGFSDNSIIEMFGLTYTQSLLLFSAERAAALYDTFTTRSKTASDAKRLWISEWEKGIVTYLKGLSGDEHVCLYDSDSLNERFAKELQASNNRTWYYILGLELLEFEPYTALGGDYDNLYKKCKAGEKPLYDYVKKMLLGHGFLSEEKIDRLDKTYCKSLNKISGKAGKTAAKILAVVAVGAIAAAFAAVSAPAIAVSLFGAGFEGLAGAALTNACLALAGGGAVAVGGGGVAGGIAAIAGGGALLGLAGGGAMVGAGQLLLSSPEYALTQAAKLETILKEVILNAQKDVVLAQKIIAQYKEQIDALTAKLNEMEIQAEKNKEEIKKIKLCIKYLKNSCKDMNVFTSAYEVGMET